jgi:hypothetical protein
MALMKVGESIWVDLRSCFFGDHPGEHTFVDSCSNIIKASHCAIHIPPD